MPDLRAASAALQPRTARAAVSALMIGALCALAAPAFSAALPEHAVNLIASVQGIGFEGSAAFGNVHLGNSNGGAAAMAGTDPAPVVWATTLSELPSILTGARAELSYYSTVTGGRRGDRVGLEITAMLDSFAFSGGGARATLDITDLTTSTRLAHFETCDNLGPAGVCTANVGRIELDRFAFDAFAGHTLLIALSAQATSTPGFAGSGTATVDPYIAVAPPYAASYGIDFSPGITQSLVAVPEPATWALWLVGLAGLGLAAHRFSGTTAKGCPVAQAL